LDGGVEVNVDAEEEVVIKETEEREDMNVGTKSRRTARLTRTRQDVVLVSRMKTLSK
jgi:hypothetical protein